jgi:hypothetical protein
MYNQVDHVPCPEVILDLVALTTGVPQGASAKQMIDGSGSMVKEALDAMLERGTRYAEKLVQQQWEHEGPTTTKDQVRANPGLKLYAPHKIVGVRLAAGMIEGEPGWVAYGTLCREERGGLVLPGG